MLIPDTYEKIFPNGEQSIPLKWSRRISVAGCFPQINGTTEPTTLVGIVRDVEPNSYIISIKDGGKSGESYFLIPEKSVIFDGEKPEFSDKVYDDFSIEIRDWPPRL